MRVHLCMDFFSINTCNVSISTLKFMDALIYVILCRGLEHSLGLVSSRGSWNQQLPINREGQTNFGGIKSDLQFSTVWGLVPLPPTLFKDELYIHNSATITTGNFRTSLSPKNPSIPFIYHPSIPFQPSLGISLKWNYMICVPYDVLL